jgi:hypothetical protein
MVAAGLTATCAASYADEPMPDYEYSRIPVGDRPHPEYDPIGYRVGSFFIYPSITAGGFYNSNVFASHSNPRADFAALISPQLTIDYGKLPTGYAKAASSFAAELDVGADIYRFHELASENRTDAHARLKTHWEIAHDLQLDSKIEVARRHEERGDSGEPIDARTPVPYLDAYGETALTKTFGRFGVELNGSVRNLTYDNVVSFSGVPLDQSARDGSIFTTYLRPFYEFSPGYRVFVRAAANTRNYAGTGAENRDSSGYDVRAGLDFTLTPLIYGSIGAGYLSQRYDNPLIEPIDGPSFKGEVTWLATPLLTAKFSAERKIAETVTPGFDARIDTNFDSRLDYEFLRNVIFYAAASYRHQDYRGTMGRTDRVSDLAGGFRYLMNRHLSLGGRYDYIDRNSTQSIFSYDQHVVMFNVTAQF